MGKKGYLFKSVSSVSGYAVSLSPDLSVFGERVFDARGWEQVGRIDLTTEALGRYVVVPEVALKELEEKRWYRTSLEDEQYIYRQ
jgi:hypothetical protein